MPCIQAARGDGSSCTMPCADCPRRRGARLPGGARPLRSRGRVYNEHALISPRGEGLLMGSCLPSVRLAFLVVPIATLLAPSGRGFAPAPLRHMGRAGPTAAEPLLLLRRGARLLAAHV